MTSARYSDTFCYKDISQIKNSLKRVLIVFSRQVETGDVGDSLRIASHVLELRRGEDGCEWGVNLFI